MAQKINFNLLKYLPKVHKELHEAKEFRKRVDLWIVDKDAEKERDSKEDLEG